MANKTAKEKAKEILMDILSPLRFAGGGLIQAPVLAATQGKVNIPLLSNAELEKMSGNTFGQRLAKTAPRGAREIANAASYAIPFGKQIEGAGVASKILTKALLPGAGVGLLQGLSRENATPASVAKSTAGGAATAGALEAGSSVLGKLLEKSTVDVPKRLMNSVFKEKVGSTKASLKGGSTLGQEALSRGIQGKNAEQIYQDAVSKMGNIEDEISGAINTSKRIIPIADIKNTVKPLIKKYSDAGDLSAVKSITDRITALEEQHGPSIPIQVAQEVKRTLYDELNGSYGAMKNAEKEGLKTIARSLKEGIASKVTSKDINKLNKELSVYGRIKDSMLDKMTREERNNVIGLTDAIIGGGGLVSGAGIPAIGAIATKKLLGSTAGKTGIANILSKAGENLPKGGNPVLSNILGQAGAQVGSRAFSGLPQQSTQVPATDPQQSQNNNEAVQHAQSIPEQNVQKEGVIVDDNGNKFFKSADGSILSEDQQWKFDDKAQDWVPNEQASNSTGGIDDKKLQDLLTTALLSGDKKNLDFVVKYVDAVKSLTPDVKKTGMTDASVNAIADFDTSVKLTNELNKTIDSYKGKFGPISGRISAANKYDTDAQAVQAQIKAVAQVVGKAMEGGVLRKEDVPKYEAILPNINDTPDVAKRKIKSVVSMLETQKKQRLSAFDTYKSGNAGGPDLLQQLLQTAQ